MLNLRTEGFPSILRHIKPYTLNNVLHCIVIIPLKKSVLKKEITVADSLVQKTYTGRGIVIVSSVISRKIQNN